MLLDANNLKSIAFLGTMLLFTYKGPGIIKWATHSIQPAPKDREVRSSKVVDEVVAAKLARKSQSRPDGRVESVRTDALVDEEMGVGTIES